LFHQQNGAASLIEVFAKEIGHRGVTDNSILPAETQVAGRHAKTKHEFFQSTKKSMPMNRSGTLEESADADEYLASDLAAL
jgi:3-oxoacyl-[acyl-carrier protein] reductase